MILPPTELSIQSNQPEEESESQRHGNEALPRLSHRGPQPFTTYACTSHPNHQTHQDTHARAQEINNDGRQFFHRAYFTYRTENTRESQGNEGRRSKKGGSSFSFITRGRGRGFLCPVLEFLKIPLHRSRNKCTTSSLSKFRCRKELRQGKWVEISRR